MALARAPYPAADAAANSKMDALWRRLTVAEQAAVEKEIPAHLFLGYGRKGLETMRRAMAVADLMARMDAAGFDDLLPDAVLDELYDAVLEAGTPTAGARKESA